jgi:hypothetical protein
MRQIRLNSVADLVADAAEGGETDFLGTIDGSRIIEGPMQAVYLPREYGAGFLRVVANGDNEIERLAHEFIDRLGAMVRDIDADLAHDGNRFRTHVAGLRAGREDHDAVAGVVPQ